MRRMPCIIRLTIASTVGERKPISRCALWIAIKRRSNVAADSVSANEARYSTSILTVVGTVPPCSSKCRRSLAYARLVAADCDAAINWSAAAENEVRARFGGVLEPLERLVVATVPELAENSLFGFDFLTDFGAGFLVILVVSE